MTLRALTRIAVAGTRARELRPRELRHGRLPFGRDASPVQYRDEGQNDDLRVEQQRAIVHVPQVKLESVLPRYRIAPVDLCPPSEARADEMTTCLFGCVQREILGHEGSGTDKGHVPYQDVPQLRQ